MTSDDAGQPKYFSISSAVPPGFFAPKRSIEQTFISTIRHLESTQNGT